LTRLRGSASVSIGLIDGAIDRAHPTLAHARIEGGSPAVLPSPHATFIASIFAGQGPGALGVCRDCTIVSIPKLSDDFAAGRLQRPRAAALLAEGIHQALDSRVDVIHLSVEFWPYAADEMMPVARAVTFAASCGVRTVCAAGNHPTLGSAPTIGSPGFVPVAAADTEGRLADWSPVSGLIGSQGISAPGVDIPGASGQGWALRSGSSIAAAFVTAVFALFLAESRNSGRDRVWSAILGHPRPGIVPPALDAGAAFNRLRKDSSWTTQGT
jgi:subtilisin family serine protease